MKKLFVATLSLLGVFLTSHFVISPSGAEAAIEKPPLPAAAFFQIPQRFAESLSPDGSRIAFLGKEHGSTSQIKTTSLSNIASLEDSFTKLQSCDLLTPDAIHTVRFPISGNVTLFFWLDHRIFAVLQDEVGNSHYFLCDPQADSIPKELHFPQKSRMMGFTKTPRPTAILGVWREDQSYQDGWSLDLETGASQRIFDNQHGIIDWETDGNGTIRAGLQYFANGDCNLVLITGDQISPLISAKCGETLMPLSFSDNNILYVLTNVGEEHDLVYLAAVDVQTGRVEKVCSDPKNRVDVANVIFSPASKTLLAVVFEDENLRTHFLDQKLEADFEKIQQAGLGDQVRIQGFSQDESRFLVEVSSGGATAIVYWHDRKNGVSHLLWNSQPEIPQETVARTQPIDYLARDGLPIPAYLTLPISGKAPYPLVVFPHGGLRMRTHVGFDGRVQFLASRGYAVLQPNFRGSKGYGKAFINAGNLEWGGKMQEDITDGVLHLIAQGVVDKERIAIFGGSYGGYAALAGLAFTPEIYAAGVCLFGSSAKSVFSSMKTENA